MPQKFWRKEELLKSEGVLAMNSIRLVKHSKYVVLIVALFFLLAKNSYAIVLKGYFPTEQGCFWNFFKTEDNKHYSWAINGTFTQRNVGSVFVLSQDNGSFMSVRDEWGGLYIYGEYWPNKYLIPDEPLLFLPYEMKFDSPINYTAHLTLFTRPKDDNFKAQKKITRHVSLSLESIEDMMVGDREIKNCAKIEKTIKDENETVSEILWLAPTIGPIKRIITLGKTQTTHTLTSYAGSEKSSGSVFFYKGLLPAHPWPQVGI